MGHVSKRLSSLETANGRLTLVGGILLVLSVLVAAWAFTTGDVVTGLGMGLFVGVGLLFVAIGTSPDPATPPE
jgi:hypothetical protein